MNVTISIAPASWTISRSRAQTGTCRQSFHGERQVDTFSAGLGNESTYVTLGLCRTACAYEKYTKLQKINPNKWLPVARCLLWFSGLRLLWMEVSSRELVFWYFDTHLGSSPGFDRRGLEGKTELSTWYIRCLRDSFAHGQSKVVNFAGMERRRIWNTSEGVANIDFDVSMALDEFAALIKSAVTHAICLLLMGNTALLMK